MDSLPMSSYAAASAGQVSMAASFPTLDDWEVMDDGSVVGIVSNHPAIEDGDTIATSPIENPNRARPKAVVTTMSGSRYHLGTPSAPKAHAKWLPSLMSLGQSIAVNPDVAFRNAQRAAKVQLRSLFQSPGTSNGKSLEVDGIDYEDVNADLLEEARRTSYEVYEQVLEMAKQRAAEKFELNGLFIGKYLLSGKPITSTSGKSQIFTAYRSNSEGLPGGDPVIVKVSPVTEALKRERDNYLTVTSGFAKGQFVKCYEFYPEAAESTDMSSPSYKQFSSQCAIVLERGEMDLKSYLNTEVARGLRGNALRDAAMAAAQCLQALHSSNMVWTDLKTENFIVTEAEGADDGITVKGIDLESAMPMFNNPVDYSPEACPPEFAEAFLSGDGPFFALDPSYDVWSYGMMLYEISTGEGVFDGQTPAQVTKNLADPDFEPNFDNIQDKKLRNLVKACLRRDHTRRPSVTQIMLHSYFLSSYSPFRF